MKLKYNLVVKQFVSCFCQTRRFSVSASKELRAQNKTSYLSNTEKHYRKTLKKLTKILLNRKTTDTKHRLVS